MLRVCIVGAGPISREFALHHFGPATGTVVSAVVDLDAEKAKALATDVGSLQAGAEIRDDGGSKYHAAATEARGTPVPSPTSLGEALGDCDAVYIGTTPGAHAALTAEALAAGKHVLLEKPLASTPEDADKIVSIAEAALEQGQHVGMNIGMRWNPACIQMRQQAIEKSALGPLRSARLSLHFRQWPREWQTQPWVAARAHGGPLREVGTHYFFGIMEVFGHGCVRRVQATVDYPDGPDGTAAEISAHGQLDLGEGLPPIDLSVRTDLSAAEVAERTAQGLGPDVYELEVVGEAGTLMLEDFSKLRRTAPAAEAGWVVENGSYGRTECVKELVAAIAVGKAASSAGVMVREGRNAQRLLDAILASNGEWKDVSYD